MSFLGTVILIGASFASTSSDPAQREAQLSENKCALTYKRTLNFVKHFPPERNNLGYVMYDPKLMGYRAYDMLGDIYYRGCAKAKLAPDKVAAAIWYQSAAVIHLPESQWKLGRMLVEGDGIPSNKDAGFAWLTSSALEGSPEAANYLRALGEPVPTAVSPNSYTLAAEELLQARNAARAEERAQIVRDLGGLLVTVGSMYVIAKANSMQVVSTPRTSVQPLPSTPNVVQMPKLSMTKPVYCNSQGDASAIGNTLYLRIYQFCY